MDWLMMVLLTCAEAEGQTCDPTLLQRPATWLECEEQARALNWGHSLITEWQGEMRGIVMSTCIPMREALAMGLVQGEDGS